MTQNKKQTPIPPKSQSTGGCAPEISAPALLNDSENELEAMLLNDHGAGDFLQSKLCSDAEAEMLQKAKKPKKPVITDFSSVPEAKVFSFACFYTVFNRKNQTTSILHGVQVESLIGLDTTLFNRVKTRATSAFCVGDYYIKFLNCKA